VYQEAELYLLDDILSNVDFKVGTHIFHHCINGFLKSKTRILVTSNSTPLNGTGPHFSLQNGALVRVPPSTPVSVSNLYPDTKHEEGKDVHSQMQSWRKEGGSWEKRKEFPHGVNDQIGVYWKYLTVGSGASYVVQYIILTSAMMILYHGMEYFLRLK